MVYFFCWDKMTNIAIPLFSDEFIFFQIRYFSINRASAREFFIQNLIDGNIISRKTGVENLKQYHAVQSIQYSKLMLCLDFPEQHQKFL